jgi:hypothetical protein
VYIAIKTIFDKSLVFNQLPHSMIRCMMIVLHSFLQVEMLSFSRIIVGATKGEREEEQCEGRLMSLVIASRLSIKSSIQLINYKERLH